MPAKRPAPRLAVIDEPRMNDAQRALLNSLRSGPRGSTITPRGPFAVWMHAPNSVNLPRNLAHIVATGPLCRQGFRNSPYCARPACGARNTNGSRTRPWPKKAA